MDKLNLPTGMEATGGFVFEARGEGYEPPELGACCACGGVEEVDAVVMINRKALTKDASVWGCIVCGISGGACIVLCAKCRREGAEVKWGCTSAPKQGRAPIEEFTEVLNHDPSKHHEVTCHHH